MGLHPAIWSGGPGQWLGGLDIWVGLVRPHCQAALPYGKALLINLVFDIFVGL